MRRGACAAQRGAARRGSLLSGGVGGRDSARCREARALAEGERDSLVGGAPFGRRKRVLSRREKGESPRDFRRAFTRQIGPVVEANRSGRRGSSSLALERVGWAAARSSTSPMTNRTLFYGKRKYQQ